MTKRGTKKRTCRSGKVRYHDAEQAKRALRHLRTTSTRDRIQTGWYCCPGCLGYHLTSSGQSTNH